MPLPDDLVRVEPNLLDKLTAREHQVLTAVEKGLQSKEIAPLIGVSPRRVDKVIERAREKLDAPNRVAAGRRYRELLGRGVILPLQPSPLANRSGFGPPVPGVPADAVYTLSDVATFKSDLPWARPQPSSAPKRWATLAAESRLVQMLVGSAALCVIIIFVAGLMLVLSMLF